MKNNIAIQASNSTEENIEIIKILENLGGKNTTLIGHTNKSSCYYIREDNLIECSSINYYYKHLQQYKLYTLEKYKKEFMENKEMKITPPEGYEIDKENSTFEKIIFKKVEEKLTYEKIIDKLFQDKNHYFIDGCGNIRKSSIGSKCPNLAPTEKQLQILLAINKLMNVAYYLNDGWKPDWRNTSESKYSIIFNGFIYTIENNVWANRGGVVFKSMELAEQAIEILGKEVIKTALRV